MFNKEAFAMYFAIKECEYMLRGKYFILQGDHRNLKWIEASAVPKVIRWRIYMQSFSFQFDHIAGKRNIVADWQSRLFSFMRLSDNPEIEDYNDRSHLLGALNLLIDPLKDLSEQDLVEKPKKLELKLKYKNVTPTYYYDYLKLIYVFILII